MSKKSVIISSLVGFICVMIVFAFSKKIDNIGSKNVIGNNVNIKENLNEDTNNLEERININANESEIKTLFQDENTENVLLTISAEFTKLSKEGNQFYIPFRIMNKIDTKINYKITIGIIDIQNNLLKSYEFNTDFLEPNKTQDINVYLDITDEEYKIYQNCEFKIINIDII